MPPSRPSGREDSSIEWIGKPPSSQMSRGARDDEERPFTGQSFEHVRAALFESDPRACHKVFDGIRDEHFSGPRRRRDARADVDGDATDLVAEHFALTRMETAPYVEPERSHVVADSARTADRARRPVERREETVAGAIDLAAAKSYELAAHRRVVLLEQLAPSPIRSEEHTSEL